jgi:hypothetical protein
MAKDMKKKSNTKNERVKREEKKTFWVDKRQGHSLIARIYIKRGEREGGKGKTFVRCGGRRNIFFFLLLSFSFLPFEIRKPGSLNKAAVRGRMTDRPFVFSLVLACSSSSFHLISKTRDTPT